MARGRKGVEVDGVTVEWTKTFSPRVPGEGMVLSRLGAQAAGMLRHRIRDLGQDSEGRQVRPLATGKPFVHAVGDDRFGPDKGRHKPKTKLKAGEIVRRYVGPEGGPYEDPNNWTDAVIYPEGYASAKKAGGKKGNRNLELTGRLWRSLRVRVQGGGQTRGGAPRDRTIRIDFAGSDKSIKVAYTRKLKDGTEKTAKRSLSYRDKAQLAWYGPKSNNGKTGEQIASDRADLMRFSYDELDALASEYLGAIQVFEAHR